MLAFYSGYGAVNPWLPCGAERVQRGCGFLLKNNWWWRAWSLEVPPPQLRYVGARAQLSGFPSSRVGLDSQNFQSQDSSKMLWVGPVPGDIAELEAYCRIFRAAEQLHTAVMETLCNPETGECNVLYDRPSEDMPVLEQKVVAVLGCMLVLLNRGREDVLSGRYSFMNSFEIADTSILDGKLPPLAIFRGEMKRCCESLRVALANYLMLDDDRGATIWRRLHRLKNVCYDAGFSRGDGYPCPMVLANCGPVYFSISKDDELLVDSEVAFWRGGQVTDEGLAWLVEKGFKTIVDLRDEAEQDVYYQSAIDQAVALGKIEVINLPVEVGTSPSMKQVEQFASLVSDSSRRPIYLHSQEGVGRTSAMVSRWKQYATRNARPIDTYNSFNGKPSKNTMHEESDLDFQNIICPNLQGDNVSEDKIVSEFPNPRFSKEGISAIQYERQDCEAGDKLDSMQKTTPYGNANGTYTVEEESFSSVSIASNPLKAQFPTFDVFSRKEMTQFFKQRKISPVTYLNSQRKKFEKIPDSRKKQRYPAQGNGVPFGTTLSDLIKSQTSNVTSTDGDIFLRTNVPNISNAKQMSNQSSPSSGASLNGFPPVGLSNLATEPEASSNSSNDSTCTLSPSIGEKRKTVNGFIESVADGLDLVQGNMCASTTGVVRVQSRKKAEMFLVRTDGFSCVREKVTESSLAFTHPTTQQQMLMWKSTPKTVLLLKKLGDELMEETKEVASFLHSQEKMNVLVEPDVHDTLARIPGFGFVQTFYCQDTSDLHERVDFVACLGGDGVILHASNLFRGAVPPVVSFNLGSLGFLTSHTFEEYRKDLGAIIHGNNMLDGVYITLRMRLRCEILRNGKAIPGKIFDVLNEVVVDRGSNPYLSKIECYEHNRLITKVQGDGVIVATPTGSTAYSTSAGGSMVHPNVPCVLFTPICPHSLSFRPVILPDSAQLELKIPEGARSNAWVSFDGKRRQQLSRGDSIRISMSEHPLPTVNKSDQTGDWFLSLVRCLNWNERLDQKAL
ncbi:putative NAD(+) kinase [Dioscorea sansibarensis]